MKIVTMKVNDGKLGVDQPAYEITYRKDESSEIKNVTIDIESKDGILLSKLAKKFNRKLISKDEFMKEVEPIVERNTSIVLEKALDTANESKDAVIEGQPLSARIQLVDGVSLFVDGIEVNSLLSAQIIKMVQCKAKDPNGIDPNEWLTIINFTERLYSNTIPEVREQLYAWFQYQLKNGRLTLTKEGNFIGYKGVRRKDGNLVSIHSGPGIVDGVAMNGNLPNNPGSTVEMARKDVNANPDITCSTGLHVGSYDYANSFGNGLVISVEVDPRDVVSVPYDYNGQKIRTCKYKVIKEVKSELEDFSVDFSKETHSDLCGDTELNGDPNESAELKVGSEIASLTYGEKTYANAVVEAITFDSNGIESILVKGYFGYRKFFFNKVRNLMLKDSPQKGEGSAKDIKVGDKFDSLNYVTKDGVPKSFKGVEVLKIAGDKMFIDTDSGMKSLIIDNIKL